MSFETLQLDDPRIPDLCREKYRALLGDWPAPGEFCPRAAAWAMAWLTATQEQALSQPAEGQVLAAPRGKWEGGEYWMPLAWQLCADECGEDACNELVWEGGPIPEPWGDRWLKYEHEAKRLISLVHEHAPYSPTAQPVQVPTISRDALIEKITEGLRGTWHCGRVWDAWSIGTMSDEDFSPVDESDTPTELADAILGMLTAAPLPPLATDCAGMLVVRRSGPVNRRLLSLLQDAVASFGPHLEGGDDQWLIAAKAAIADAELAAAVAEVEALFPASPTFPERADGKTAEQGIFRKFIVQRVDGSDHPGGKHHGCRYFVLDLDHDQHAHAAMTAYGRACAETHPALSEEILASWPEPLAAQPVGREALSRKALVDLWGDKSDGPSNSEIVRFGREVERAHGITGEGM